MIFDLPIGENSPDSSGKNLKPSSFARNSGSSGKFRIGYCVERLEEPFYEFVFTSGKTLKQHSNYITMTDKDEIFSRIRKALEPIQEKTPYPEWEDSLVVSQGLDEFPSLWDLFCHKFREVHGVPLEGVEALAVFLKEKGHTKGYCDPQIAFELVKLPAFQGIALITDYERDRMEDYQFGITRAAGAIAETGTIILKDKSTSARLGALSPWTHAAILEPEQLWPDVPTALNHVLDDDPSIILVTGPSKTADIEGVLIEGVHGPGIQICCLMPAGLGAASTIV